MQESKEVIENKITDVVMWRKEDIKWEELT